MTAALVAATLVCLGLQAYHYVGYPLVILALGLLRPRPVAKATFRGRISLIVAAYDEAASIVAKIDNSLALDWPDLEIIVVADGSRDATPRLVAGYAHRGVIGLFDPRRRGKAAAMNRGAEVATGELLVFSDANAFYERDALRWLAANFADPAVGCVSGRKTVRAVDALGRDSAVGRSDGLYWRYESRIREWESRIGSTASVVGEMMAARRRQFIPLPRTFINDDAYLALLVMRSGLRVVYEPRAVCWEYPSNSMREEALRRRRMIAGRCQLLLRPAHWPWRQPLAAFCLASHKLLRLVLPFLMLAGVAANAALLLDWPMPAPMLALLVLQAVFYGLAVIGLGRAGRRRLLPRLACYVVASNLHVLGGLAAYAMRTQGVLWEKASRSTVVQLGDRS